MLTIRYNFETNSSSMHSLAIRACDSVYSKEDLQRVETARLDNVHDAVIVMDDSIDKTYVDKYYRYYGYQTETYKFSSYDLDFRRSPMSLQCSFWDKMQYVASLALSNPRYRYLYAEIEKAVVQFFEKDFTLSTQYIRDDAFGVNSGLVGKFLEDRKISVFDFLADPKYIIVVNVAEFFKMQFLNMVDMSKVQEFVCTISDKSIPYKMNIQNGVWMLREGDIHFGRSPYRVLGTVEGKARYALAGYGADEARRAEILSIVREVYPEIMEIAFPTYSYSGSVDYGYVEDDCMPVDVSLRDFILDKRYVVISDGDEYCVWSDFKDTPLFNKSEYTHEPIDE